MSIFHGDNGAGLGASHQTGWTGLIARTLDLFARLKPEDVLRAGKGIMAEMTREPSCRSEESTANGQDSRRGNLCLWPIDTSQKIAQLGAIPTAMRSII
jgi:hypothetical protein